MEKIIDITDYLKNKKTDELAIHIIMAAHNFIETNDAFRNELTVLFQAVRNAKEKDGGIELEVSELYDPLISIFAAGYFAAQEDLQTDAAQQLHDYYEAHPDELENDSI